MTEREIELQAKLEQAERERDHWKERAGFFARSEGHIVEQGIRTAADWLSEKQQLESALAAAQGALRQIDFAASVQRNPLIRDMARAALAAESGTPPAHVCVKCGSAGDCVPTCDGMMAPAEPRAAPPALPAEPGWEAPSLAELFMGYARENHAMSAASPEGTWDRAFYAGRGNAFLAAADRVPHAPALPAELSGKGEQPAPGICDAIGADHAGLHRRKGDCERWDRIAAEPVMGWSAWCDHLTAVHEKFRSEVKRLLADGIGPGGGYYAEDQRLTAAVGLLGVGWGACPVKEPGEAKKEEP